MRTNFQSQAIQCFADIGFSVYTNNHGYNIK